MPGYYEHIAGTRVRPRPSTMARTGQGSHEDRVINSVAARQDAASTPVLVDPERGFPSLRRQPPRPWERSARPRRPKRLSRLAGKGPAPVQKAVVDGTLICAERLVAAGQRRSSDHTAREA